MSDSPGQVESAIFSSMPTLPHDLQVRPAGSADRPRLLQWILSHDTEMQFEDPLVRELLARHQRGLLSLELLLQADSGGENVGAAWGQVLAGRIGVIWPVRLLEGTSPQIGLALLDSIDAGFKREGVVLPVSLVDIETSASCLLHQQLLGMAGYQQQTTLQVMSMPVKPSTVKLADPLKYQASADHLLLATILEQTEVESEDIPEIQGIRSGIDILATFEQETRGNSHAWYVVLHEGIHVGCLLLASQADQRSCSIQYMGLRPEYRSRGWGCLLVRHALAWAHRQEASLIRLMVDSRNQRATRLYQTCGLVAVREQQFWMRQSGTPGG